ncbi:class I SAM-dependent methyltransferase [Phenylobacterium sp.]|uniref:class I SAM-dependent methyltransferase n=1 Tax=Phenylobacterium sp. TaxID=1871053 RepID=UPI0025D1AC0B|nr:class I SAM-dependent methyltransferase [Phenylobacterium sp.]
MGQTAPLSDVEKRYPALDRLVKTVVDVWPEHRSFIDKSLAPRTEAVLQASDRMAAAVLELTAGSEREHAENYHWLCERIKEEELAFARTERYRYSTFAETNAHVYSDPEFMHRYMDGLLYSHVLWFMHLSSLHFFIQRLGARVKAGGRVLEVGSGHGLLLYLCLSELKMGEATAWDLSQASLDQTRAALARLGALDNAKFAVQDMHKAEPDGEPFDLIILSHLLEHLEDPVDALKRLKPLVAKGGYIYVNVPLNAPMPDHLILLRTPDEAARLLVDGGFRVVEASAHTTQGVTLSRALKQRTAVTCSIIAEPA